MRISDWSSDVCSSDLAQIVDCAMRYDPQPIHIDLEAAKEGPFSGLIASGFQTLALAFRLFLDRGFYEKSIIVGPGLDELRWTAPVRPGDTLKIIGEEIGRASWRERGCQYGEVSGGGVSFKKNNKEYNTM